MIDLPNATLVHRRLPKEAFYRNLTLTPALKEKFVSDVERIILENSLKRENLHLSEESEVKEILLLTVVLKKKEIDGRVLEAIAKQNPHKLVFLLSFADSRQLALYHRKLYRTPWMEDGEPELRAEGLSLSEIWESFVEQIALREEDSAGAGAEKLSIDERLKRQEQIAKLQTQIEKTEKAAWKEQQPKKRFALYQRLQDLKKELEELENLTL